MLLLGFLEVNKVKFVQFDATLTEAEFCQHTGFICCGRFWE